MLKLRRQGDEFWYPLLSHPLPRVLKFEYLKKYIDGLAHGETVIDYGSGDRPYEQLLLTKFSRYVAADYNITNSKHSKKPDLYVGGDRLDVLSDSVNCVVLTEVLEHLYEPVKVLSELYRILQPGGRLIGTVPFVVPEHEEPYDFHRYTYYALQRMFQESGFRVIKLEYVGDNVGVCLSVASRLWIAPLKVLSRAHLGWVAAALNALFKIPELVYVLGRRAGLDPQRVSYFQKLPLGFAFCLEKPERS